ncbi:hypothetical protein RYA05_29565 [Pseudomonas syringae pv. actinidiae]|uniref:hypothetical protein n=2 Tax=Pseudomonas syringae TaxID=317 RepID=UPI000380E253|nr:hypothetical protein [Pseudomonas syringae]MDU8215188.1 hypothetical protein [Pseudomonas syringae pv. actinidiae]MDU8247141.1 hypothetical protein [Pseudomonas syringae pv. actinidiae]MDU8327131.1 hypothetical protein [Pseudomonas syringae pv. actinidiae]MDU8338369.1 hypothetical protein [Pseudomonas syringae pv. actinidiae]MDU8349368.1 hypothetical protein [Pseudomonas syringae pv. actinidiae]
MEDTPNIPAVIGASPEDTVTRESLYEQAWSTPMTKIAERYGVSSSYLARVFTHLNIPRPAVGYWAKVAAGKRKATPPLPEVQPGALLAWSRNGAPEQISRTPPKSPAKIRTRSPDRMAVLPRRHPLLVDVEEYFKKAQETDEGYLRPSKRSMADLIVSRSGVNQAVDFANQLFLALMKKGLAVALSDPTTHMGRESVDHREVASNRYVHPAVWRPQRPTVVYVGTVVFGLSIYEISEYVHVKRPEKKYVRLTALPVSKRRSDYPDRWMMSADMPSSRLCLQVYSPYHSVEWIQRWTENKPGDLASKIPGIVTSLLAEAPILAGKVEIERIRSEQERQRHQLQMEEWRRKEDEKRRLKVIQDSRDRLETVIQTWAKVNSIQAFFEDIVQNAQRLETQERQAVLDRLAKAMELIGDLDAPPGVRIVVASPVFPKKA